MTLADKRKVIEVLMCCSSAWSANVTDRAADAIGYHRSAIKREADAAWLRTYRDYRDIGPMAEPRHHGICTEAAYRLIESSPTLRLEWFGAR